MENNKINILMLSDSFFPIMGGRETVIDNLMRELNKISNITLGTTTFKGHTFNIGDESLPYKILRCKSFKVTKNEYLSLINRSFKREIESKIKAGEVDIIHIQTKYSLASYAFKLRKKYNIPVVATAHTNYPEQYKKQLKFPPLYKLFLNRVKKVLNKVDALFTVSSSMKTIIENMGIKTEIIIIPNGTDIKLNMGDENLINVVNAKYNLNHQTFKLLYVGRITETKNITMLLESLKILKEKNYNFEMVFVGEGEIDHFKKICEDFNLTNMVKFIGAVSNREELKGLYLRSDLHLAPSKIESFGLTVREASALGTPSVVINGCATSEGIKDKFNGFIAEPTSTSFASQIKEAMSLESKLKEVGERAKNTHSFTWEEVANLHLKEYQKVINKKESGL